ncbi:MAG TPA: hypothetical protein VLJ37_00245 [bacterium]|nr:hypothetical protein [bacterium]
MASAQVLRYVVAVNPSNRGREVLLYVLGTLREFYPYVIAGLATALALLLRIPDKIFMIAAGLLAVGLLVYYRYNESKKMKQRTYEAMSPDLRDEINRERRQNLEKRRKFTDAMDRASSGGGGGPPSRG